MTDYSSIKGNRVQYLTSDPTLDSNSEGQVWYNSTTSSLKGLVQIKAWSSGGNMGTARRNSGAAGTQTASVAFGGGLPPNGNPDTTATEEYNGFNWSTGGNMNTEREGLAGAGTQTATLGFGGADYTNTGVLDSSEEYNGSAWTSGSSMNNIRGYLSGFGIQTAAIAAVGNPPSIPDATESYDGTSWTNLGAPSNTPATPTSIHLTGSCGTQTAGIIFGGSDGSDRDETLEWNGTTWTAGGNLILARRRIGAAGIQTSAVGFGGYTSPGGVEKNNTEEYDGSAWTTSTNMGTALSSMHGSGTRAAALSAGGLSSSAITAATEEYNSNINAITKSVWASGGNLPAIRSGSGGAGIQTSALNIGGENGAFIFGTTEEYNGSSWTSGGTLNATPSFFMAAGGTQTAALRAGGFTGPIGTDGQDAVEEYNGSSWASETALPTATGLGMFAGTTTQGLFFGGQTPPTVTTSLSYDGSTWTATNSLAVQKSGGAGFGTQTAALAAGGSNPSLGPGTTTFTDNTQIWDGTNWTTTGSLNTRKTNLRGWGNSTSGAVAGGRVPAPSSTNQTEEWNGTTWTSSANLGTGGYLGSTAGGPNASSGLYAGGGRAPSNAASTATEEFTGGTEVVTASTLTTS